MKRSKKVGFTKPRSRTVNEPVRKVFVSYRWYTIQIQPQMQMTAIFNLKNQDFEAFFPSVLLRRPTNGRTTEPMFRGYGFVCFNPSVDRWSAINNTKGVIGLLPRSLVYPMPMPIGFVEQLKLTDPTPEQDFSKIFDEFFPGLMVEVADEQNAFVGRIGEVLEVRQIDRRNSLLVVGMKNGFKIEVDGNSVAKV